MKLFKIFTSVALLLISLAISSYAFDISIDAFSLYAEEDDTVNISLSSPKNLLDGEGSETVISAIVDSSSGMQNVEFSYSIAEGEGFITLTDYGNGSARVVSKAEGLSKILCTTSTGEKYEYYILSEYHDLPDIEVLQDVVDMSAHRFEGNHLNSGFDETEEAYKFICENDVVRTDDGNGNVTYYTDGFMRISTHGEVDTSVYKYLLLTMKADNSTNFQIRYYTADTGWRTISQGVPNVPATNGEYITYAIDMENGTGGLTISEFVVGTYNSTPVYIKDMRYSNIPSLTPEKDEVRKVVIIDSPEEITSENNYAEITAVNFGNKKSDNSILWKISDPSKAMVTHIDGNKYELSTLSNGEVTVTACDTDDESISDSFTVTISGQREKIAVYDLKVLFWGASVTKHGPHPGLEWYNNWGMAASSEDKDYVHRLVARLEEEFYPSKVNYEIVSTGSGFDRDLSSDTNTNTDYSNHSGFTDLKGAVERLKPNIIMADNGGNLRDGANHNCILNAYCQVYDMIYDIVPDAIVCSGYCHLGHRSFIENAYSALGEHYKNSGNIFLLNHYQLAGHPEFFAPEWLELDPPQPGVASHWGDAGMDEVSRIQFNAIVPYIRSNIIPEYVYIPEQLEIEGSSEIKSEGGTLQLTAVTYPSDTPNDVEWSVDDTRIAVINGSGVLTAVNNGTVTVTAQSKYNAELCASFVVEITGQPESYSVKYDANTLDTVSGIPEDEIYARGETILSDARPLRDCYTFVGWSENADSAKPVTSVDVAENTTVYAIWKKTEGFEFEGEYDEHFGYVYGFDIEGGFHAEITGGNLSVICTSGEKVKFNSPKVDIPNSGYVTFALDSAYFDQASSIEFTVYTENGTGIYTYPLTSERKTVYGADTSMLDGNITGFEIFVNGAPDSGSMFGILMDYVRFNEEIGFDVETDICISDGVTTLSTTGNSLCNEISVNFGETGKIIVNLNSGTHIEISECPQDYILYISSVKENSSVTVNCLEYDSENRFLPVLSKVYTFDGTEFSEDETVNDVLTSYDKSSIRTKYPMGLRMMASATSTLYVDSEVLEYGFIVTKEEYITDGKIRSLVLDDGYTENKLIKVGAAYNSAGGTHKIYDIVDGKEFFTAALINIPETKFALMTKFAARPYIKLSDGRIIYGAITVRSVCDTALAIVNEFGIDDEIVQAAERILEICEVEYSSDGYIDIGGLLEEK